MKTIQPHVLAMTVLFLAGLCPLASGMELEAGNQSRMPANAIRKAAFVKTNANQDQTELDLLEKLESEPRNVKVLTKLAWVYNDKEEFDKAALAASAAILLDKKAANAWRELGYARLKQEKYEKAIDALTQAVKLNPKDKVAWAYLALTLDKIGEPELADKARQIADYLDR